MTAAHFAAAHYRGLIVVAGIVVLVLVVAGARRPARAPVAPDGSWKVGAGLVTLAAAILVVFRRHHPATAAPAPRPAPTITHIVTHVTSPSHPLLSTWLIALTAAVIIAFAGWIIRRFR
jgi:hypothetical protein